MGWALGAHRCARLDRENPAIGGLVGASSSADVENRLCIAKRGVNPLGDPRIRPAMACVCKPALLVVDPVSSHQAAEPIRFAPSPQTGRACLAARIVRRQAAEVWAYSTMYVS